MEPNVSTSRVIAAFIRHNGLEERVKLIRKHVEDITEQDLNGLKVNFGVCSHI